MNIFNHRKKKNEYLHLGKKNENLPANILFFFSAKKSYFFSGERNSITVVVVLRFDYENIRFFFFSSFLRNFWCKTR